jgi:hypothetical protein
VRHRLRAAATSFFQRALEDFTEADQAALADLLGRFVDGVLASSHRPPAG